MHMKQKRETVLSVLAHDKDEARYVAELAAKSTLFYTLDWDKTNYYFDFLSQSECLYYGYEQSACSEWIREKKKKGYSYKAVLRGVLDNYDYDFDLAKNMVTYAWNVDGTEKEREILHYVELGKEYDEKFGIIAAIISCLFNMDMEEAEKTLNEYWIDEEHPLEEYYDYGDKPKHPEYWY